MYTIKKQQNKIRIMNLKKFIYNLFFKKKKKNSRSKSTKQSGSSVTKSKSVAQSDVVLKNGKYDTTILRQKVSETEYISNMRIGRSWILPQLVEMGFKKKGLSRKFDLDFYEKNILKTYNLSQSGRCKIWNLLKRNYKAIAVADNDTPRARWWSNALLVEMMEWDFDMVGKRSSGLDREGCKEILASIDAISNPNEIYDSVLRYDKCRMRTRQVESYRHKGHALPVPSCFVDAFMGDGAYNAMMTMVKILGVRIKGDDGNFLSRDECIAEIENQATILDGRELMKYCKDTFFDSGLFDYKKYMK